MHMFKHIYMPTRKIREVQVHHGYGVYEGAGQERTVGNHHRKIYVYVAKDRQLISHA